MIGPFCNASDGISSYVDGLMNGLKIESWKIYSIPLRTPMLDISRLQLRPTRLISR